MRATSYCTLCVSPDGELHRRAAQIQLYRRMSSSWSVDGTEWKPVADNFSIKLVFGMPSQIWTSEAAEFVQKEALGDLDEPLGHELLREALENSEKNLRSALVLAVVAAEVGFKQFASKSFPDADWILEHLPSPPLVKMLEVFPWRKLGLRINGKVPRIPAEMERELTKAIKLRNDIVHAGNVTLKRETVDSVLTVVRDLLYFLDALRGQKWALKNVRYEAVQAILTAGSPGPPDNASPKKPN